MQVPDRTLLERCLDASELVEAQSEVDKDDRKTHQDPELTQCVH